MNQIKKAQNLFKLISIISSILLVGAIYKISIFSREQKTLQYMPIGQYKIISDKNVSEVKDVYIQEYKIIINPDSIVSDITATSEMIIETAKNTKKYNGSILKFYGNPKDLKEDNLIAKVIYAPYGKLEEALKGDNIPYNEYEYKYQFISQNTK